MVFCCCCCLVCLCLNYDGGFWFIFRFVIFFYPSYFIDIESESCMNLYVLRWHLIFQLRFFFLIDSFIWIISLIQNYYACAHWFRVSACKQFFSLSFFNLHIERWGIKRMSTQLIGLLTVYVNQMVFPWILIFGHPFFSVQNYYFFYSIRNTRQITFLPIC